MMLLTHTRTDRQTQPFIVKDIFTLFAFNQKLAKILLDKADSSMDPFFSQTPDNSRKFSFPKSFVHFLLSHLISFFSMIHNVMLSLQSSRGNETQK